MCLGVCWNGIQVWNIIIYRLVKYEWNTCISLRESSVRELRTLKPSSFHQYYRVASHISAQNSVTYKTTSKLCWFSLTAYPILFDMATTYLNYSLYLVLIHRFLQLSPPSVNQSRKSVLPCCSILHLPNPFLRRLIYLIHP